MKTSSKWIRSVLKKKNNVEPVGAGKPKITDLEARLCLYYIPLEVIKQSVEYGMFDDVEGLEIPNAKHKLWCPICTSGKMMRHYHYVGSMNHHNMQKTPGSSWSLDTFGPVPGMPTGYPKYMLVTVDNVSR